MCLFTISCIVALQFHLKRFFLSPFKHQSFEKIWLRWDGFKIQMALTDWVNQRAILDLSVTALCKLCETHSTEEWELGKIVKKFL